MFKIMISHLSLVAFMAYAAVASSSWHESTPNFKFAPRVYKPAKKDFKSILESGINNINGSLDQLIKLHDEETLHPFNLVSRLEEQLFPFHIDPSSVSLKEIEAIHLQVDQLFDVIQKRRISFSREKELPEKKTHMDTALNDLMELIKKRDTLVQKIQTSTPLKAGSHRSTVTAPHAEVFVIQKQLLEDKITLQHKTAEGSLKEFLQHIKILYPKISLSEEKRVFNQLVQEFAELTKNLKLIHDANQAALHATQTSLEQMENLRIPDQEIYQHSLNKAREFYEEAKLAAGNIDTRAKLITELVNLSTQLNADKIRKEDVNQLKEKLHNIMRRSISPQDSPR